MAASGQHDEVRPIMDPTKNYEEINSYVIFWGLFYAALFALAVGYLCLKIGQTVDAFAPVSILSMGMAVLFKRKNAFPETVHIQAIASSGTNVLCGAMFILPALFILDIHHVTILQMIIPIVLGGMLGVFLCIFFRQYFCVEMHHAYPFPGGRAAAEVLSSNDGSKAKLMALSGLLGLFYDFVLNSLGWWREVFSTTTFKWGQLLQDKSKVSFSLDSDIALLGLGYFTGLRYGAIIAAGSFFAWFVCIPVFYFIGGDHLMTVGGKEILLADAPVRTVFTTYVRHIGIGMLAMAGVIGLLTMSNVVSKIMKRAIVDMFSRGKTTTVNILRTERDLPNSVLGLGIILTTVLFGIFFHIYFAETLMQSVLAFLIVLIMSFLLSVVGISSIAFTGNEPVSGMTIFMILISAVVLTSVGMGGTTGIIAILMMAAFLGTTIGVAGNFMSEHKVAHLTGATPAKMQTWQLVGVVVSSIVSVGVLILLNNAYGFVGEGALNAPQANAMAAIVEPLMTGGSAPWPLYIIGAVFAVLLWMVGVPPLAFALGTYLPMEINTPILLGGFISYLVKRSAKDEAEGEARVNEGGTIASGFVAGGAIGSLISAVLRIAGVDWFLEAWEQTPEATYLGIVIYLALCVLIYKVATRKRTAQ
ncbi:OPT family oligopeptide transporter [Veillonella sp. R32]|uniref:OPT family oligopeptide transporter n=1 Tax=Veillonella sp. R32 TaxID=2021312 RepID=UPI0013894900|nr:oligopeptide transporter, OPT family [Veillonella sp. R32]KAF1681976.1 oligopeptide transporter, OPT family [Veillonella sp. R32]